MQCSGLVFTFVLLVGCSTRPIPTQDLDGDDLQIVRAIARDRLESKGEAPAGSYIVFVTPTLHICDKGSQDFSCITADALGRLQDTLRSDVYQEFLTRNSTTLRVPSVEDPSTRVEGPRRINRLVPDPGEWDKFYQAFPNSRGFVEMSAPAYDASRTHAIVIVIHMCGGSCGIEQIASLSRVGGDWKVLSQLPLWIS